MSSRLRLGTKIEVKCSDFLPRSVRERRAVPSSLLINTGLVNNLVAWEVAPRGEDGSVAKMAEPVGGETATHPAILFRK
jgi:hypothetical protein